MQPTLYIFVGYPGAGKTTVAQAIHDNTGAVHLWADHERHVMFGNPTHSGSESRMLYEKLNSLTESLLGAGQSVIYDTNFNFYADREMLRAIAVKHSARMVILWITTDRELAKRRATTEGVKSDTRALGTMTPEEFDVIANKLEPPRENEKVIKIDGTNIDVDALLRQISV